MILAYNIDIPLLDIKSAKTIYKILQRDTEELNDLLSIALLTLSKNL